MVFILEEIVDGQDGDPAEGEDVEESADSDEEVELTEEEKKKKKEEEKKSKEDEKLRSEIEKEILAKFEKEKTDKALKDKDKKEKVSDSMKGLADSLRVDLGDNYPEAFNRLKIADRITAMIGMKGELDKLKASAPIAKGKSSIPKPKPKEGAVPKKSRFKPSNSMKERAKKFDWIN